MHRVPTGRRHNHENRRPEDTIQLPRFANPLPYPLLPHPAYDLPDHDPHLVIPSCAKVSTQGLQLPALNHPGYVPQGIQVLPGLRGEDLPGLPSKRKNIPHLREKGLLERRLPNRPSGGAEVKRPVANPGAPLQRAPMPVHHPPGQFVPESVRRR
jgi:hypothetical protein